MCEGDVACDDFDKPAAVPRAYPGAPDDELKEMGAAAGNGGGPNGAEWSVLGEQPFDLGNLCRFGHPFTPHMVARLKLPGGCQLLQPICVYWAMLLAALGVVPLLCHSIILPIQGTVLV